MPAKFQLKKGSTGKFRFTLLSTNGQVVATSQAYERKATAMTGIRSVQKIAGTAEIEDTTTKQWADADTAAKAAKAAKKSAKKAPAKVARAAKKVVTKAAKAPAPKKAAAASAGTPRKSVAATATRPVRKAPPPLTAAPENLTPKL